MRRYNGRIPDGEPRASRTQSGLGASPHHREDRRQEHERYDAPCPSPRGSGQGAGLDIHEMAIIATRYGTVIQGKSKMRPINTGSPSFARLAAETRNSARILAICAPFILAACAGGEFEPRESRPGDSSSAAAKNGGTEAPGGGPTGSAGASDTGGNGPVEAPSDTSANGGNDSGASDSASGDVPNTGQTTGAPSIPDPTITSLPGPGSSNDGDSPDASNSVSTESN